MAVVPDAASPRIDADQCPEIELLDPVDAAPHREVWLDLIGRSLDPNVFLDPDFVIAAAQHLGPRRPRILFVWAAGPTARRLIAVHALARSEIRRRALARPWTHDLVPYGAPLLDAGQCREATAALLGWALSAGAAGLYFSALPTEGPTAAALLAAARDRGMACETIAAWRRAVLWQGPVGAPAGHAALSAKGAKETRRQRRRLAECGTLGFESARSPDDVRDAVERFLVLEARGWKGAAGTALLTQPGRTVFTRSMTRLLVPRGRCRIDSLTLDGAPVAMGIVLTDRSTDFLWKIAYDERFARLSPGVQFVLDFTQRQQREARAAVTDSCAIAQHPMIDRLWRDRLALADLAIGGGPGYAGAVRRLRLFRRLRDLAKRARAAWNARDLRPSG